MVQGFVSVAEGSVSGGFMAEDLWQEGPSVPSGWTPPASCHCSSHYGLSRHRISRHRMASTQRHIVIIGGKQFFLLGANLWWVGLWWEDVWWEVRL